MKKYGNTEWQYMAAMARDYASKMHSNYDEDAQTGKRIYAIVSEYDRKASSELQRLYENEDVEAVNICTYPGGYQTICVKYKDGTEYNFDTDGCYDSLDDMICHEIYAYITGRIDESKPHKNMKRTITESQLRNIIAESIKTALFEMEQEIIEIQNLSRQEIRQSIDENWIDFEEIMESWLYECESWEINVNKPQYSVSNCNKDKADEILMTLCNLFHIRLNTLSGIVKSIKSAIATMDFMSDNNNLLFAAHYVVLKEIRCINALIEKVNMASPIDKRGEIEDWEIDDELNEDITMGQRVYIYFMDIPKVQSLLKDNNSNRWILMNDSIYKSYPCYIKHASRYKDGGIRETQIITKYCKDNGIRYKIM